MEDIRIVSYISPTIEESLANYSLTNDTIDVFKNAIQIFSELKHSSIFVIPNFYLSVFDSNPQLRIIKEVVVSDSQSNIFFGDVGSPPGCHGFDIDSLFPNTPGDLSLRQIVIHLSKRRVPVVVDYEKNIIKKVYCDKCGEISPCFPETVIDTCPLPKSSVFRDYLTEIADFGIKQWSLNRSLITAEDIKILGVLLCVLHDVPKNLIPKLDSFVIHANFFDDIRENKNADYAKIAFSMLRALLFSSANDPTQERHVLSIDWHRHSPHTISGMKLYRVDVVLHTKSGLRNSGTERLLLGVNPNTKKKIFLAYTDQHDFVEKTIKTRIQTIE